MLFRIGVRIVVERDVFTDVVVADLLRETTFESRVAAFPSITQISNIKIKSKNFFISGVYFNKFANYCPTKIQRF